MTSNLLKEYLIDIFFLAMILLIVISMFLSFYFVDILYLGCAIYYYIRIRLYRWKKCH